MVESWTKYSTMPNKVTTREGMREIIHRERLIELAFEGESFSAPQEAEKYLTKVYGDYMALPPKEQRTCKHSVEFISRENRL